MQAPVAGSSGRILNQRVLQNKENSLNLSNYGLLRKGHAAWKQLGLVINASPHFITKALEFYVQHSRLIHYA